MTLGYSWKIFAPSWAGTTLVNRTTWVMTVAAIQVGTGHTSMEAQVD